MLKLSREYSYDIIGEIGRSPVLIGMSVSLVMFVRSWNLLLKSQWLVSSVVSL